MGRGAWQAAVHGIAKSRTGLSNSTAHRFRISKIQHEVSGHPSPKLSDLVRLGFLGGSMFLISYVVVDEGV